MAASHIHKLPVFSIIILPLHASLTKLVIKTKQAKMLVMLKMQLRHPTRLLSSDQSMVFLRMVESFIHHITLMVRNTKIVT